MLWLHTGGTRLVFPADDVGKTEEVLDLLPDAVGLRTLTKTEEEVVQHTVFQHKKRPYSVEQAFIGCVLQRGDKLPLGTFAKGHRQYSCRTYVTHFGQFLLESGKGYPNTLLDMAAHYDISEFVRAVVITCHGFKITKRPDGGGRIVLTKPLVHVFKHESVDPLVVFQDLRDLWQEEFLTAMDRSYVPDRPSAFDRKFTMTGKIEMRGAYSTDESVVREIARLHPASGLAAYFPSHSASASAPKRDERLWLPQNEAFMPRKTQLPSAPSVPAARTPPAEGPAQKAPKRLVDTPPAPLGVAFQGMVLPPPAQLLRLVHAMLGACLATGGATGVPPAVLLAPPTPQAPPAPEQPPAPERPLVIDPPPMPARLVQPLSAPAAEFALPGPAPEDATSYWLLPPLKRGVDALSADELDFFD